MTQFDASNPYDKTGYFVLLPTGEKLLLRRRIKWIPQESDKIHILLAGEMLDMLAQRYYSNLRQNAQYYYWLIADANDIVNPLSLDGYVGKAIIIPDITKLDFIA